MAAELAVRSASKAAAWSASTGGGRNDVDRMCPASSRIVQWCSTENSWRPAGSNPARDTTSWSGSRCLGRSQPGGTRPAAPRTFCPVRGTPASARCQSREPAQGEADQHSARQPPGLSQVWASPATAARRSRWKALPMTIDSKLSGPAGRSSAPTVIARMCVAPTAIALARTTSVMSGSASTHHTSAGAAQREGELAGAAGQVEQPPTPRGGCPAYEIGDHRVGVGKPEPVVVVGRTAVQIGLESHVTCHASTRQVVATNRSSPLDGRRSSVRSAK